MKRYCLALDLKDDASLINEYEQWHRDIPAGITKSIKEAGIIDMQIYRTGNRMFMVIESADDFTFERKQEMDSGNPDVQKWEELMWKFQQPLPNAEPGEKWKLMQKIFQLKQENQ